MQAELIKKDFVRVFPRKITLEKMIEVGVISETVIRDFMVCCHVHVEMTARDAKFHEALKSANDKYNIGSLRNVRRIYDKNRKFMKIMGAYLHQ